MDSSHFLLIVWIPARSLYGIIQPSLVITKSRGTCASSYKIVLFLTIFYYHLTKYRFESKSRGKCRNKYSIRVILRYQTCVDLLLILQMRIWLFRIYQILWIILANDRVRYSFEGSFQTSIIYRIYLPQTQRQSSCRPKLYP